MFATKMTTTARLGLAAVRWVVEAHTWCKLCHEYPTLKEASVLDDTHIIFAMTVPANPACTHSAGETWQLVDTSILWSDPGRCLAKTKAGTFCQNDARPGGFCGVHAKQVLA